MSIPSRVLKTSLLFLSLALLHGCGGGGGGDPAGGGTVPTAEAPPAVTQKIPATGGSITAALADGAQVVLTFPAGAVAADVDITVTPSVPASGDWLSFQLSPGTEVLLKPVTLLVTPPAGLDATQLPQLRLGSAADPLWLISKTNADGTLEAVLPALPLPSVTTGARAVARTHSTVQFAALAPLAPADATSTTITGANFVLECELSQAVIDDATIVLDRATESDLILKVINLLANIKTNCGVSVSTQGLLEQFASDASLRHINATTFFSGLDYTSSENFVSFAPRLRRALSWCRVAQLLNAQPIACPNVTDFQLSFSQLIVGISNVASATEELYELRNQYKKVLPLAAEAAAFGADNAEEFLRRLSADLADLLIKRAYAICNHGDLYDFLLMIELGAPSSYSADTLRNDLAYCGTQVVARVLDNANVLIAANERTLLPGGVDDVRPDRSKSTPVPLDGALSMTLTGRATSCSRVIGAPLGTDELVVKVGTTELQRFFHNSGDFNGQFDISKAALLTKLGKPADSKDPIEIEVWRENVVVRGCADENDVAFNVVLPDVKLYTVTVGDVVSTNSVVVRGAFLTADYNFSASYGGVVPEGGTSSSSLDLNANGLATGEKLETKQGTVSFQNPDPTMPFIPAQLTYNMGARSSQSLTGVTATPGQISGMSGGTLFTTASCLFNRGGEGQNGVSATGSAGSRSVLDFELLRGDRYIIAFTASVEGTASLVQDSISVAVGISSEDGATKVLALKFTGGSANSMSNTAEISTDGFIYIDARAFCGTSSSSASVTGSVTFTLTPIN